jgi:hypothetical protein
MGTYIHAFIVCKTRVCVYTHGTRRKGADTATLTQLTPCGMKTGARGASGADSPLGRGATTEKSGAVLPRPGSYSSKLFSADPDAASN